MALIGIGDLVLAAIPATNLSIAAVAVPLLVVGAGFKLAVTSITVVAVNSVPTAEGRHGERRDQHAARLRPDPRPGHRRSAIALTNAANAIAAKVAASPTLQSALDSVLRLARRTCPPRSGPRSRRPSAR